MNLKKYLNNVVLPYRKSKKILDLYRLEHVYKIDRKFMLLLLFGAVLFVFNRRYLVFGLLALASALFSFYHSKYNRTPADLKLALVLGLFITREYGLFFTMIFFIVSDIIPALF